MTDLPPSPALLALARDVLLHELLPLLPEERRLDARRIATCMAIAERETQEPAPTGPIRELDRLYGEAEAARHGGCEGTQDMLRRFACGLRNGAFENSPEREALARAILWRMTIARLRLANPRFLAANGFA
ncbi:MAG TPA: DUF6285 domain-containing protein [Stellaceae bacterium]|nr:DUF6285 domain-containing protein [Stellaceae bacterium]